MTRSVQPRQNDWMPSTVFKELAPEVQVGLWFSLTGSSLFWYPELEKLWSWHSEWQPSLHQWNVDWKPDGRLGYGGPESRHLCALQGFLTDYRSWRMTCNVCWSVTGPEESESWHLCTWQEYISTSLWFEMLLLPAMNVTVQIYCSLQTSRPWKASFPTHLFYWIGCLTCQSAHKGQFYEPFALKRLLVSWLPEK